MNATIVNNSDITLAPDDEVIFHEDIEGEIQGRFVVAKVTTLVTKQSSCNKIGLLLCHSHIELRLRLKLS